MEVNHNGKEESARDSKLNKNKYILPTHTLEKQLVNFLSMYMTLRISNQLYNYRVRKITYEGSSYREGDVVVMAKDDDNTPMFGVIRSIYYYHNEDKCFLTVTDMQADYHSHYHAYHVVTSSHTSITTPQALHTPHAFNTYTCCAEHLSHLKFVPLKFFCVIFISYT